VRIQPEVGHLCGAPRCGGRVEGWHGRGKAGFVGAIDATHALEVNGPSCKVDAEIARVAYVKL
jgi:hypothetical protein